MKCLRVDTSHRWRERTLPTSRTIVISLLVVMLVPTPSTRAFVPDHPVEDGAHYWLIFPRPSNYGVVVAMAVPLETVNKDVTLAFNFDTGFDTPTNATELSMLEYEFGWKKRGTRSIRRLRDISRGMVYEGFEKALQKMGLPERPCLLRAICEAAERPMGLDEHDLLADIVHLVLTPSRSDDKDIDDDHHRAERLGLEGADCAKEFPKCGRSILSFITVN